MLINLDPIKITSPYGERIRNGIKEFHPGIDIRVVDEKYNPFPILSPEKIKITDVKFDPQWGHYIKAAPVKTNELGITEFRFWHIKPLCVVDEIINEGNKIGTPESGFVPLHLHFETRIAYRGKTPIDPIEYLKLMNIIYI